MQDLHEFHAQKDEQGGESLPRAEIQISVEFIWKDSMEPTNRGALVTWDHNIRRGRGSDNRVLLHNRI